MQSPAERYSLEHYTLLYAFERMQAAWGRFKRSNDSGGAVIPIDLAAQPLDLLREALFAQQGFARDHGHGG